MKKLVQKCELIKNDYAFHPTILINEAFLINSWDDLFIFLICKQIGNNFFMNSTCYHPDFDAVIHR